MQSCERLLYIPTQSRGVARGRNEAVRRCTSDVLIFIDDDCTAEAGLADSVRAAFDDPTVGLAFGTVTPAGHDAAAGYIVGFEPRRARVLHGAINKVFDAGIGACMAVRVRAARDIPFDARLGPGSEFPSCEEGDLAYRMLCAGWSVAHVPEARVVHHGFRFHRDGHRASRDTGCGVGAAYVKHARLGDPAGCVVYLTEFARVLSSVGARVVRLQPPFNLASLQGFLEGSIRGATAPLDHQTRLYR